MSAPKWNFTLYLALFSHITQHVCTPHYSTYYVQNHASIIGRCLAKEESREALWQIWQNIRRCTNYFQLGPFMLWHGWYWWIFHASTITVIQPVHLWQHKWYTRTFYAWTVRILTNLKVYIFLHDGWVDLTQIWNTRYPILREFPLQND